MATQVRYFDYGSRVRSKNSAEPFGLINGIGPVFGFDVASLSADSSKIILESSNKQSDPNNIKLTYISDENGGLQIPDHLLINVDGIITALYGSIELDKVASSKSEYMVVATHNYTPTSEIENPTIISLIPNNTSTTFKDKVNLDTTRMGTWYDTVKTWDKSFNQSTTVILAFIDLSDTSDIKVYNPYNNSWKAGSSSTQSDSVESVLSYSGSGDVNTVDVKSLTSIDIYGFKAGSKVTPMLYAPLKTVNNPQGALYKYIDLEVLKLKSGLWSIKGCLKYTMGVTEVVPKINANSDSESKDDYNTLLNYYTLFNGNIGFKIKNIKKLLNLESNETLKLVSQNSVIDTGLRDCLSYGSKFLSSLGEDQSTDLSVDSKLSIDPIASTFAVVNFAAATISLSIYFDITVKKQIAS